MSGYSSLNDVKGDVGEESKQDDDAAVLKQWVTIPKDEFKLVHMRIKDAESPKVFWEVNDWTLESSSEQRVEFPAEMLQARAISREIVFFSKNII